MYYTKQRTKNSPGAVSLAAMIVIGAVILEIGIASAVLVLLLTSGGLGARLSQNAYIAAQAGIQDVHIKLVRNKNLCITTDPCSYSIVVGTASADVTFDRDADPPRHIITAVGHAITKERLLCAKVEVDSVTGLVTVVEVVEKELTSTPSC